MRVLHLPFTYYPDQVGGTELYVEALCRELSALGVESLVAAPGDEASNYEVNGVEVHRFVGADTGNNLGAIYGAGDEHAAQSLADLVRSREVDIVHFHGRTRLLSLRSVRAVKAVGAKVVLTYHTPTVSCMRGTMMRNGREPCNGEMTLSRCTSCYLSSAGLHPALALALGHWPLALSRRIRKGGGVWTALRMKALADEMQGAVTAMFADADHVVAVCEWVRGVLRINGVPESKLTLCRQGLVQLPEAQVKRPAREGKAPLKVCFLGRLDPNKGLDVLLAAMRLIPDAVIELDVYAITLGSAAREQLANFQKHTAEDPRVRFLPAVPSGEVVELLANYDLLAVPSQWLETGPLVVLEAQAAGVPVLGAKRGGIAELVTHGVDGLLVESADCQAWAEALRHLASDAGLLATLKGGARPPRKASQVAVEMAALYAALTQPAKRDRMSPKSTSKSISL
jgi:glycosyltransferase involved in cell wall biosynthesis